MHSTRTQASENHEPCFGAIDNHIEDVTPLSHNIHQELETHGASSQKNKIINITQDGNGQTINGGGANVGATTMNIPNERVPHNSKQCRTQGRTLCNARLRRQDWAMPSISNYGKIRILINRFDGLKEQPLNS
jgi:hypothetical protein